MKSKRILSVLLSLLLAVTTVSALPAQALAGTTHRLAADAISFGSGKSITDSDKFDALPVPAKSGFYYMNDGAIRFCNMNTGAVRTICTVAEAGYIDSVYVEQDSQKIYTTYKVYTSDGKCLQYLGIFNAATEQLTTKAVTEFLPANSYVYCVGVDHQGRYYFSASDPDAVEHYIYLLSSDFQLLNTYKDQTAKLRFCGFDATNGNFYYISYSSRRSMFGTTRYHNLSCGRVVNNQIHIGDNPNLDTLYEVNSTDHYDSAAMLANGDLAYTSTYYNTLGILNSAVLDPDNLSGTQTGATRAALSRYGYEAEDYEDLEQIDCAQSVGTRAIYNSPSGSYLFYTNNNTITEYNQNMQAQATLKTEHRVFAMYNYDNQVLVMEKDDNNTYYVELLQWIAPTVITLSKTEATISVGGSTQLTATDNGTITSSYTWNSNNVAVASVDKSGRVYGNRAGTATITVTAANGVSADCQVTVNPGEPIPGGRAQKMSGAVSANASANDYSYWSAVVNSHLIENSDGTLSRIEQTGTAVRIETYSADGKSLLSSQSIPNELSLFGGFFAGKNNNYLVFGQKNTGESANKEVVRIVQYTKNWKRIGDCRVKDCNTTVPFRFASLRMTELDGQLYVYTGHEMYADDEGQNHQANLLLTVDENNMKLVDAAYQVANLQSGYISHSLNQFIDTDGKYIYRVDHSESNNYASIDGTVLSINGITLCKYNKADGSKPIDIVAPVTFTQNTNSYTGAAIGDFAIGSGMCLIAYTQDVSNTSRVRNVKLNVTDTDFTTTRQIKLTNYTSGSKITCRTPQLVKINENLFLMLWEEYNSSTDKVTTKAMTVTADGKAVTAATVLPVRLSDCPPVLCSDGTVKWYVTNNAAPQLYTVNPYDLTDFHRHNYTANVTRAATCTATGQAVYTCTGCGDSYTATVPKTAHTYNWVTQTRATSTKDGQAAQICSVCGATGSKKTIYKASAVTLSASTYTYDGKTKTPGVTVKDSKGNKLSTNKSYKVTQPSGRKNVGRYQVKIQLTGDYSGTVYRYFNITPKGTGIKSLTAGKKAVTVKLNLQKTQTTGYQIQYATNKNFKSAKTVNVSNKTGSKKLSKLSGGKRYYVRVRTYKTVKFGGKNYTIYSGWSSAKSVVTKK